MKNQEEQAQAGGIVLFPKMKGDDKNHEIRFKQIERTLKHALDEDERRIIEMKYLGSRKVKDSFVYNELMIKWCFSLDFHQSLFQDILLYLPSIRVHIILCFSKKWLVY
ncbi:hypothetical protein [Bacillus thuringiensis]|uniref:hypothetical protein n=2 Tax=Bacillus TaxID=1386 RepID=UPI0021B2CF5B|nr:hypothetical protein [Bacillus thuringiensis]